MKDVSISELRAHLSEFIQWANRKGPIRITSRGKEVARIIPGQDKKEQARQKLETLRKTAKAGNILSPVLTDWDVLE
jgi:prevent-host-death family protein